MQRWETVFSNALSIYQRLSVRATHTLTRKKNPTTERQVHTVTHFRHHYSAECSKFVADTIFHALTRETSQVEINKTCVCSLKMFWVAAEGGEGRAGGGQRSDHNTRPRLSM